MHDELDRQILQAIQASEGIPTVKDLSYRYGGPVKAGPNYILRRIQRNAELSTAFTERKNAMARRAFEVHGEMPHGMEWNRDALKSKEGAKKPSRPPTRKAIK